MGDLSEQSVLRHNPRVAARIVEGHALVVVLDQRQVHRLDEVGSRIWELCDGRTLGAICDQVVSEFEVTRDEALEDMLNFIQDLRDAGALIVEGEA